MGPNTFTVPADLFTAAPEKILIGALIEGHSYVSPPDEETENAEDDPEELLSVATAKGLDADQEGARTENAALPTGELETFGRDRCPRDFATERGRDAHRRQSHPEG